MYKVSAVNAFIWPSKAFINTNIDLHNWACVLKNVNLLIENPCNKDIFCKSVLESITTSKWRVIAIFTVPLIYMFNLNTSFVHQKWTIFLPIYSTSVFIVNLKPKNFELIPSSSNKRFNSAICCSLFLARTRIYNVLCRGLFYVW